METWVEENTDTNKYITYKFTGKELDEETGLYYFGARYYDPKTSTWASCDPILGDYLPVAPVSDDAKKHNSKLPGQGGVFNPVNLNLYHYAGNNPIKYVDPTGNDHKIIVGKKEGSVIHNEITKRVGGELRKKGYNNVRLEQGMKYDPTDKKGYSRKMPDIRADKNNKKYIWEIKQNGENGVNNALNSLDKYYGEANKAGDQSLIPGEPVMPNRFDLSADQYVQYYSVGNGVILYDVYQRDGQSDPVPEYCPVTQKESFKLTVCGVTLTGAALVVYLIVSEGSRVFVPRNAIPIP